MNKIRILIADDQVLMRDGLKTILNLEDDMEVVGTAKNGLEAFECAKMLCPDVILMDIRMPEMDGVESAKLIKKDSPKIVVIMLTTFDDDEYIIEALSGGANGYLLKDIPADKLIDAIHDGVNGNLLMPASVAAKLAARISKTASPKTPDSRAISEFSDRELEIAKLLVKGLTNRQISAQLFISEGTVKNYISSIYSKIEISDRTQALIYLKELGL